MIGVWIIAVAGLAGASLGSYVSTAALRSARGEQSLFGRSACDACGVRLGFAQTAPLISYLRARGLCMTCGGRIDPAHPAGEMLGAMIVISAFLATSPARAVLASALGLALLTAAIVDARTRRLPDLLTIVVAAAGLALAALRGWPELLLGCAAAAVTFALMESLRRGFRRVREDPGLGFGDVKLAGALALWLGVQTPWALTLAAGAGLAAVLVRPPKDGRIAFGPFIAAGTWVVGLWREVAL